MLTVREEKIYKFALKILILNNQKAFFEGFKQLKS